MSEASIEKVRGLTRTLEGVVTSDKMNKSVIVAVMTHKKHREYGEIHSSNEEVYSP